jgi:hypothetical protein
VHHKRGLYRKHGLRHTGSVTLSYGAGTTRSGTRRSPPGSRRTPVRTPSGRLSGLRVLHSKSRWCGVPRYLYGCAARLTAKNGVFRPGQ